LIPISATLEDLKAEIIKERRFISPFLSYTHSEFVKGNLISTANYLISSLNLYAEGGSGFRISKINYMQVRCAQYIPIAPRGWIKTPKELSRGSILNVKTKLDNCFALSILCCLYRSRIPTNKLKLSKSLKSKNQQLKRLYENPKSYQNILLELKTTKEIDLNGFLGAVDLEMIEKFETRNHISVSVFSNEGKNINRKIKRV